MSPLRALIIAAISLGLTSQAATAADQTIRGSLLLLKNPGTPSQRRIVGKAKERVSSDTIVGDPTGSPGGARVRGWRQ